MKPQRDKVNKTSYRENWWLYAEKGIKLYNAITNNSKVLTTARVSKTFGFSYVDSTYVYDDKLVVFNLEKYDDFAVIQSSFHNSWAWQYSTKMKSDLSYTPRSVFQTFPFPRYLKVAINLEINNIGNKYYNSRSRLMLDINLGLTKTYNAFHSPNIYSGIRASDLKGKTNKEIEKKYGKETWNLWNHLQKIKNSCTWEEAVEGIEELRCLHVEMDIAVLEAYGWHEDSEKWGKAIALKHDFYEVDYLPENDRVRFTIHPNARKEVLKRLLLLNHERYEEEIKQGLHKKKDVEKFYAQKGQPVPAGVVFADGKAKKKTAKKKAPQKESIYNQPQLFETPNLYNQPEEKRPLRKVAEPESGVQKQPSPARKIEWHHSLKSFKVILKNSSGHEFRYHVLPAAQRGKFTKNYKQINPNSPMALNIIGKQEGDSFEFGEVEYRIERIEF